MKHMGFLLVLAIAAGCAAPGAPTAGVPAASDPTALARGAISQTSDPVDLAINGDAFFVLARVAPPTSLDDLVFTRDGDFAFEFRPGAMPNTGTYRLRNADGLAVMSWRSAVDVNVRPFGTPPEESSGTDLAAFRTVVVDGPRPPLPIDFGALELDHERNVDLVGRASFDSRGLMRVDGGAPRDLEGRDANIHVALAKVENPAALRHEGGGYLRWTSSAGRVFAGTAADSRLGRVVGKDTTLTPGALERLPLLTPSRYDRERYPDALDPRTALPEGEPSIKGAMVTAVLPPDPPNAPSRTLHLVSLKAGAATELRWTVTMPLAMRPIQRRGDVLRPVVAGGLARGAIVDVWTDAGSQARAIVLDRDDRPDAGLDAFSTGWL